MARQRPTNSSPIIAISFLILFLGLSFSTLCFAETIAGRVTNLSGPLFLKKADGKTLSLYLNSTFEQSDTLVTPPKTYARVKFTDGGEVVLRPKSQFKVLAYYYHQDEPSKDKAFVNLVKGGMRTATGLIGKRGDKDSYKLITHTAVAGVRGTTFECRICEGGDCGSIPDGVYFFVVSGSIIVSNEAGSQTFTVGQCVYVASATSMPVLLPANPGFDFSLPPSIGSAAQGGSYGSAGSCMCTVR